MQETGKFLSVIFNLLKEKPALIIEGYFRSSEAFESLTYGPNNKMPEKSSFGLILFSKDLYDSEFRLNIDLKQKNNSIGKINFSDCKFLLSGNSPYLADVIELFFNLYSEDEIKDVVVIELTTDKNPTDPSKKRRQKTMGKFKIYLSDDSGSLIQVFETFTK